MELSKVSTICDVSGLGTPCSTAAATAPPPTAPLVAAAEMAKGLLSEELELGRESDVYLHGCSILGILDLFFLDALPSLDFKLSVSQWVSH